jgi:hypothetical protein
LVVIVVLLKTIAAQALPAGVPEFFWTPLSSLLLAPPAVISLAEPGMPTPLLSEALVPGWTS